MYDMFVEKFEIIDVGIEMYDGLPDVVGQTKIDDGERYSGGEYDFQSLFYGEKDYIAVKILKSAAKGCGNCVFLLEVVKIREIV